ncbi:hypothetical protein G8759_08440 [Spirosoma aureum]|uniref:Uncharacterized protein n=2 Tax=Spirosoma aureum TaxID=2692134 RepID=A0A6G9AJM0_9BACT|nr:hypothetical protein G8759_08440 [Spirosoma aureum]
MPMKKPLGCLTVLAGLFLIGLVWGGIRFYGGKFFDRYQRPWAYSDTEPLLVGHWQGSFNDPDGLSKNLTLTIDVPVTDDERWNKAFKKRRRRSRSNKQAFDGLATVTSKLGREEYRINGSVNKDDYHLFTMHFGPVDAKYHVVPNFYINDIEQGRWETDAMTLTLRFSYFQKDGSSYSNSADPRFSKNVTVTLHRGNH